MNDIKKQIINELLKTPEARSYSGGDEIAVKCPRCSHLHPYSGPHLYIGVGIDPIQYDCKHCPISGKLTYSFLNELGIYGLEYQEYLLKNQRNFINKVNTTRPGIVTKNILTDYSSEDSYKIDYLSQRTGIDFSLKENILNYKVIINVKDFLEENHIDPSILIRSDNYIPYLNELSKRGVGFLGYNQNTINLRLLDSRNIKKRYINLKINKSIKSPFIYIPHTTIDYMSENPKIVVSEGAFDCICIKQRFYDSSNTDTIYGAVGSKGSYKAAINTLMKLTGFIGNDLEIYSDIDVKISEYKEMLKYDRGFFKKISVYYNLLNKDFGNINENFKIKKERL